MYLKRHYRGKGRRKVAYVSVAHNVWAPGTLGGGQTEPIVVVNLGREDRLTSDQMESAVAVADALLQVRLKHGDSLPEALARVQGQMRPPEPPAASKAAEISPVTVVGSRSFGMRLLLERVWADLGMAAAFGRYAHEHGLKFPLERVVFGMVLNRLVDPKSKRACNMWLRDLAFFPEWDEKWDVHHFYRAMDVLHDEWADVEAILFDALWERTPEEARAFWLVDTTSMYFEMTRSDQELAELRDEHAVAEANGSKPPLAPDPQVVNEPPFRMRGHNKDGHDGDPQVVIASVVTPGGLIVRHKVYAGNTNDQTIGADLTTALSAPVGTQLVWLSDAGMVSDEKLLALDGGGWQRITAAPLRSEDFAQERLLEKPGRYKPHPDNPKFSFRSEIFTGEELAMVRPEKWVVARNEAERERQLKRLEQKKAQILEILAKQRDEDPHGRGVCAVATNKSLRKFVVPSERVPGQFVFSEEVYRRERRLAGTRLLRTTLLSWEPHEIHSAYQLLLDVEGNHREWKTPMRLRPAYHRADHRIKAHVMLNVLAINCLRHIEKTTGIAPLHLRDLTERVSAVEFRQAGKTWWQCSEISDAYSAALKALGIAQPPASWTTWRKAG